MSADRAGRVREVMEGALARDTGELPRFLDESCGPDAELRREVESLLDARRRMGRYLEVPAAAALARDAELAPGERIGGYEILGVIGRGGSGVVYEARQKSPDRVVALKTVRLRLGGEEARFLEEAQTLARFRHPAIAHIYEAGVHEGEGSRVPFFSMEFVEGPGTILDFARSRGLDARGRLDLLARVADGVHYGHQRGVIHCDLKPGNILVGDDGAPRIVDFGIARTGAAREGSSGLSGTLPYMSPEQCQGAPEHLDVRCDVYALGVVLYELLAGRLPIDVMGRSITEARRRILEEVPAPLQNSAPELKGDVSAIVHKAIEKDRDRRYASAAALADDIRRHLTDHVVEAVPARAWTHVRKFARRQRVAFLSFAVAVVALIAASGVSSWLAVENHRQRVKAEYDAYLAHVAAAAAALHADDVGEARARLDSAPAAFRGWEWDHLRGRLDTSVATIECGHPITAGALSADGRFLATGSGGLRVSELSTGRTVFALPRERLGPGRADALAYSADGERLAVGHHTGLVQIQSARTGEVLWVAGRHGKQVTMVSFDPAGARFATASYDGTVRLWNAATCAPQGTLQVHPCEILAARFSPSGEVIAAGGSDGCVHLLRVPSGERIRTLVGHESNVEDVAWSPDGTRLVSASMDQTLRLWDLESGAVRAVRAAHRSGVKSVAWSPDGRTIASCSIDRTVRLWNADDLAEIATYRGHLSRVDQIQYSADGARIVSFSADGTARFWDLAHRNDVCELKGPGGPARAMAFSSDGALLAVAATHGTIGLWDPSTEAPVRTFSCGAHEATAVGFLANPRRVVAVTVPQQVHIWSLDDGTPARTYILPADALRAAITGDGRILARKKDELVECDAETGAVLSRWSTHAADVATIAVHEGAGWILAASASGEVRLWHGPGGDPVAMASFPDAQPTTAAFDPEGARVAVGWSNGTVRLLAIPSLAVTATIAADSSAISAMSFSPDGRRLATGSGDATFRLWDPATGRQTVALSGHRYQVTALAWSPDGRCIATGESFGNVVRLWRSEPAR